MQRTIMVIDDCDLQRYITETVVRKNLPEVQVISFDAAIGAVEYLHSLEDHYGKFPDVIFLDIHMPEMDGFDFLDRYVAFPEYIRAHCRIVMLSATDANEDHTRMSDYPVIHSFINKPMSGKALDDMNILSKGISNKVSAGLLRRDFISPLSMNR